MLYLLSSGLSVVFRMNLWFGWLSSVVLVFVSLIVEGIRLILLLVLCIVLVVLILFSSILCMLMLMVLGFRLSEKVRYVWVLRLISSMCCFCLVNVGVV